jgi:EAL domain-containing protein (putative c-di-GMP-specific phosphodiesterase class I)
VSARSFLNPRLIERIQWALEQAGVDGDCLEIEITEDTLMGDLGRGAEVLTQLNGLGVAVAVDDFGTGYSSLSYLKRLPINTLKIDKSFLADMTQGGNDAMIVRSIIDLGHNLGFQVVAEGVEDSDAWDMLTQLGCDAVQGYHVSRPMPNAMFTDWLRAAPWN